MKSLYLEMSYNEGLVFEGEDIKIAMGVLSRAKKVKTDYNKKEFVEVEEQKLELHLDVFEVKEYEEPKSEAVEIVETDHAEHISEESEDPEKSNDNTPF